jgi:hypothetical protein
MHDHGVHVDPSKIQVIHDWSTLKKIKKIYSFLGLSNFYHMFSFGFSHIAWPLSQVTKGGAKCNLIWAKSQYETFKDLKQHLCLIPFLIFPYLQQSFNIETDASNYDIDVTLTQLRHLMAYHTGTFFDIYLPFLYTIVPQGYSSFPL